MGCSVGHSTLPYVDAFPDTEVHAIDLAGPFDTDDGEVLVDWALAGHGVVNLARFLLAEHLASGALVPVLPEEMLRKLRGLYTASAPFASNVVIDPPLFTGQNPASSAEAAESLVAVLNQTRPRVG